VLEVTAPILEAQLVESLVRNQVHYQTLVASKAARCVEAARGRSLVDFALRRAPGAEAGLRIVRASYLAGFDATSNVLAGRIHGIPPTGTMAHSFVQCFDDAADACRAFARSYPDESTSSSTRTTRWRIPSARSWSRTSSRRPALASAASASTRATWSRSAVRRGACWTLRASSA
jgi:nicotinate phosphoribosyltransferase